MKLGRQGAALQIQQFCQIQDLITPPDTSHLYKKVTKKAFLKGIPNGANIFCFLSSSHTPHHGCLLAPTCHIFTLNKH
jgi:hypothetical protein